MARLEIPARAFVEDFCSRAFPNRDFGRGSALSDLVIKPFAALLQPYRHELDVIKVSQSVLNYLYMPTTAMDALAANQGYFRQTGAQSFGTVTLYFSTATDYAFNYLEFVSDDNVTFLLTAPVSVTAAGLIRNRQNDGTYAADVSVRSLGVGNRYQLAAGRLNTLRNRPSGIVRVTNNADFAVTAPDETNFDIVNGMFRNLGLRNLVSRQSIRGPLYDQFPGILDIFVAGAAHPKMTRDLVTLSPGLSAHVGGMIDVWVNTSNVADRTCTISYLPSTGRLRLVSAAQASADTAAFTFANGALSFEGLFTPDTVQGVLDESMGVVFSENGIASNAFVSYQTANGAALLAKSLRTFGQAIVLPSPWRSTSSVIVDPLGASMSAAGVLVGDTVRLGTDLHSVSAVAGRALELTPSVNRVGSQTQVAAIAVTGDLSITVQNGGGAVVGDSVLLSECPGAGWYRIFQTASATLAVGNLVSRGAISLVGTSVAGYQYWAYAGEVPVDLVSMPWVFQDPAGLTGTPVRVVSIVRSAGTVYLEFPNAVTLTGDVSLVSGLRGSVPVGVGATLCTIGDPGLPSSSIIIAAKAHTLYSAETLTDLAVGTASLAAVGLLQTDARVGDVLVWDLAAGALTPPMLAACGGDGTVYTSIISAVTDTSLSFVPPLPVLVPANTAWAILRNGPRQSATFGTPDTTNNRLFQTTQASFSGNDITLAGWARGLGDGSGLGLLGTDTQTLTITAVAEPVVTLASAAVVQPGDIVSQATNFWDVISVNGNDITVVLSRDFTSLAPATFLATGAINVSRIRARCVVSSQLGSVTTLFFSAARVSRTITFSATGYASPSPGDIHRAVRQIVGSTTYTGSLAAYDVALRTWTIIPNDPAVDVFTPWTTAGEEIVLIGGSGSGRATVISAVGQFGYLAPAGGDIGAKVRQGPYTGTLTGFSGTEWYVRPDSSSDLFDRTDINTYVDQSNDAAQEATEPYGYLRAPANAPEFGAAVSGPVTLTLDAPTNFANGATIWLYSRFGRTGALGTGSMLRVAPISGINDTPFSSTTVTPVTRITIPLGSALGPYDVGSKPDAASTNTTLGLTNSLSTAVSLPYGHHEETVLGATVSAGAFAVTFPTTTIGLFGHTGRALRIKILSDVYYLPIASAGVTNDSVTLAVGFPVAVSPSTQVAVAVVDAYITPFYANRLSAQYSYRITEPPSVTTPTAAVGTQSVVSIIGTLSDTTIPIATLLNGSDGLLLHIDAGQNASLTPYPITGVATNSVTFTGVGLVAESFVPYHVSYRAPVSYTSYLGYVDGTILRLPAGTAELANFGAIRLRLTPLFSSAAAETHTVTAITGLSATLSSASPLPNGTAVLAHIVRMDRTATNAVPGTVLLTYNYYAGAFMDLPVVRMLSVDQLDPVTLAPVKSLPFILTPVRLGYRYSAQEVNDLVIPDVTALGAPLRLTYRTDPTIAQIDSYLTQDDTKNQNSNTLAKRVETIVIDLSVTVRSTRTTADLQDLIAQHVLGLTSRQPVSKDGIIKYLYDQQVVTSVDVSSLSLSGQYYADDGLVQVYTNVPSIYGAETAAYLPGAITVYKVNA